MVTSVLWSLLHGSRVRRTMLVFFSAHTDGCLQIARLSMKRSDRKVIMTTVASFTMQISCGREPSMAFCKWLNWGRFILSQCPDIWTFALHCCWIVKQTSTPADCSCSSSSSSTKRVNSIFCYWFIWFVAVSWVMVLCMTKEIPKMFCHWWFSSSGFCCCCF